MYIGIELNSDYIEIAKKRIEKTHTQLNLEEILVESIERLKEEGQKVLTEYVDNRVEVSGIC